MPLIGRVHGAALGGGAGLAAVCDIVVAEEDAVFGFTEVKLGILPAVISPFVLAKIGRSAARELFLTGMRFTAARAQEIGLVHAVVPATELDAAVNDYVQRGPHAGAGSHRHRQGAAAQGLGARRVEDTMPITASAIADAARLARGTGRDEGVPGEARSPLVREASRMSLTGAFVSCVDQRATCWRS